MASVRVANRRLSRVGDETRRISTSAFALPQHNFTVSLQDLSRDPSFAELAHAMGLGWDAERVEEVFDITREPMSLETPVGDEGDTSYGDFIPDDNVVSPVERTNEVLLSEGIDNAFANLEEREVMVLKLRHGLLDGREHTLEEVGTHFGVTRERIRQIEGKALRKLKYHESRNRQLRDFLE